MATFYVLALETSIRHFKEENLRAFVVGTAVVLELGYGIVPNLLGCDYAVVRRIWIRCCGISTRATTRAEYHTPESHDASPSTNVLGLWYFNGFGQRNQGIPVHLDRLYQLALS